MEKNDKFIVEKEDEKKRIDIFLNEKFKNFSRSYIKYMILNGQLKVGEIKVKSPSYRIKLNEIINFQSL